ncbi:MAG: methyltransferase domain-containing protein [Eggerthellaceae bacterium]|nr:methyltransferase domain-containing protein [Eggerthellaceae bacterium]
MTNQHFVPLLTTHDWNAEWQELQRVRHHRDSSQYWDERSKTYTTKDAPNQYVEDFLRLADIRPGETVFDMGCGTGALSIPLGEAGHRVLAADFSAGMLKAMDDELNARHLHTVFYKQMSWDDDWSEFGMAPNMVDVCIASRSLAVENLEEALLRLTDIARRRVCITLATGSSPHTDQRILRELGLESLLGRDHLYAFNILANRGIAAEVSYIESVRKDTFDTPEEAYEQFARMIERETPEDSLADERACALKRLPDWLANQLVPNESAGLPDKKGLPEKALRLSQPRIITWAFMAWNK